MKPIKFVALFAGVGILATASTVGAADRFTIDPDHSNVVFLIDHLGYSRMIGQFQEFEGEFVFDNRSVENSSVEVTIMTASVDTDHQERDDHLRSPDFFNAVEFPEMTFESTAVERTGDDTGRITGDLTLLGVTKPVTLDVTFNKRAPHPLPQYNSVLTAGFSARGTLKRSDYGMNTFIPALGDEVRIWIQIEGYLEE